MKPLIPNTKELESKVAALGTKIEGMAQDLVGAQHETNRNLGRLEAQNDTIIQLLTEMRDALTRPSMTGVFTEDEHAALAQFFQNEAAMHELSLEEKALIPKAEAFAERPGSSYSGAQLPE